MVSFWPQICIKSTFGGGSASDHAGELTTLPDPLSDGEGTPLPTFPPSRHLRRLDLGPAITVSRAPLWLSTGLPTLIVPVTRRATLWDRAFPVVVARAWNGLPDYVTSLPTFASFRTSMKTYLFSRTFWHWQHASHWLCNVVLERCCACTTFIPSYDDDDDDDCRFITVGYSGTVVGIAVATFVFGLLLGAVLAGLYFHR